MKRTAAHQIIKSVSDFYDGNPPIGVLAKELKLAEADAKALWDEYKNHPPAARKPRKRQTAKKRPIRQSTTTQEAGIEKIHELPISFIKRLCGFVSIFALVRATGYVFDYFDRNDHVAWAVIVAFIFVSTIFVTPQIIVTGLKQRKPSIALLGLILLVPFSFATITITMDEISHKRSIKQMEGISSNIAAIKAVDGVKTLEDSKTSLDALQTQDQKARELLLNQFSKMDETNKAYWQTKGSISSLKETIDKRQKTIQEYESKIEKLKETPGYYITQQRAQGGRDQDVTRDIAFAVALDIVGPVFFAFALFLNKGKKRTKGDSSVQKGSIT